MKNKFFYFFQAVSLIILVAIVSLVSVVAVNSFNDKDNDKPATPETPEKPTPESYEFQLVKQLNSLLDSSQNINTLNDAYTYLFNNGYDVSYFDFEANLAWDKATNEFILLNNEEVVYSNIKDLETQDTLVLVNSDTEAHDYVNLNYGIAPTANFTGEVTTINNLVSVDNFTGHLSNLDVNLVSTFNTKVTAAPSNIYFNGEFNSLNVVNEGAEISVYGYQDYLNIKDTKNINIYSNVKNLCLNSGVLSLGNGAQVDLLDASEALNLTIKAEESAKLNEAILPYNSEIKLPEGTTEVTVTENMKLFLSGTGKQDNPYLITNLEHLQNISKVSDTYTYFKLLNDLTLTDANDASNKAFVKSINGVFDGNNQEITYNYNTNANMIFQNTEPNTILKDFKLHFVPTRSGSNTGAYLLEIAYDNLTIDNVDLTGEMSWSYNGRNQSPYMYMSTKKTGSLLDKPASTTFINCDVDMNLISEGYNAVFVGYLTNIDVSYTFKNCTYKGSFEGKNVGLLIGNSFNHNFVKSIIVDNVINYGTLKGYKSVGVTYSNHTEDPFYDKIINKGSILETGTPEGMQLTKSDDLKLNFAAPTNLEVTQYKVSISMYVKWYKENSTESLGTHIITVDYFADSIEDLKDIYAYEFRQSSKNIHKDLLNNNKFIIDNVDGEAIEGNNKYTIIEQDGKKYFYLTDNLLGSEEQGSYLVIQSNARFVDFYAYNGDKLVGFTNIDDIK